MTGRFRTCIRMACLSAVVLGPAAAARAQTGTPSDSSQPILTRPAPVADSLSRDTVSAVHGLDPRAPGFVWRSPFLVEEICRGAVETLAECWRRNPRLANQEIGFPGARGWSLSLTTLEPAPFQSVFFPGWNRSPYLSGGIMPVDRYALREPGGDVRGVEEIWAPVMPLDTPVTSLRWGRGALALNAFHLKLRRMLSDRAYMNLDYFSASGDSQNYDYQFQVHQPYLGGWGFLGQIYGPIDRDSLSLVITDTSHAIRARHFRPRVGFWLDGNQVLEFFLDGVKNTTSLTFPRAPGTSPAPGPADSGQSLMPASFSSYTPGVVYSRNGGAYASQWEAAYSSLSKSALGANGLDVGPEQVEDLEGDLFRTRGAVALTALPGRPLLSGEALSETWNGSLFLGGPGVRFTRGWSDREAVAARWQPRWEGLGFDVDAGLARQSRMDNRTFWLERYALATRLNLPLGFGAHAGAASERQDPDWERLYRLNPALLLFPNADLEPRTDQSWRGSLVWNASVVTVESGADFRIIRDSWLPRALPGRGDSGSVADSLALALRNYRSEERDSWHLGLGLNLGRWTLGLENRFLLKSRVEDGDLASSVANLQLPERIFKGNLGWRRSLVENRLKVALGWDWEWISGRRAWAPDLQGESHLIKLDEYLALDFMASMQIKTFLLYFKTMNLNHDRYATEPGVHPPGLNFRFGVDWTLLN